MSKSYLGYFIDKKDLPGIFVNCGGNLNGLSEKSMELTHIIRRSIFRYLMPGRVRVYFDGAIVDGETTSGITFKIGNDNDTLEKIPKDLLSRCNDIFTYPPDTFVREESHKYRYQWRRDTEVKGIVANLDLLDWHQLADHSQRNHVSTDLGTVLTGKDKGTVEASVPTDQRDINAVYEDAMAVLNSKPPVVDQKRDAATKQEDHYRSFRTNVLLAWTLSNGLLAAIVTSATGVNATTSQTAAVGGYMAFVLFSAGFRLVGSTVYMIIRLFAGE